jgi:hypothetical protein
MSLGQPQLIINVIKREHVDTWVRLEGHKTIGKEPHSECPMPGCTTLHQSIQPLPEVHACLPALGVMPLVSTGEGAIEVILLEDRVEVGSNKVNGARLKATHGHQCNENLEGLKLDHRGIALQVVTIGLLVPTCHQPSLELVKSWVAKPIILGLDLEDKHEGSLGAQGDICTHVRATPHMVGVTPPTPYFLRPPQPTG